MYLSYAYQEATDVATGQRLSNSPDHAIKLGAAHDLMDWLAVGLDARYESSRRTLAGTDTRPAFVTDLHLLLPGRSPARPSASNRFEFSLKLSNLLDATYAVPGSQEHRQTVIAQDGRTLSAQLGYRF